MCHSVCLVKELAIHHIILAWDGALLLTRACMSFVIRCNVLSLQNESNFGQM